MGNRSTCWEPCRDTGAQRELCEPSSCGRPAPAAPRDRASPRCPADAAHPRLSMLQSGRDNHGNTAESRNTQVLTHAVAAGGWYQSRSIGSLVRRGRARPTTGQTHGRKTTLFTLLPLTHTHTHTQMLTHVRACTHTQMLTHVRARTHTQMLTHVCTCIHRCSHVRVHTHRCSHVRVHTQMLTHVCTHRDDPGSHKPLIPREAFLHSQRFPCSLLRLDPSPGSL